MLHLLNPNYHAILIHFPLALLGVGLLMEIASIVWTRGGVQTAGRWMLLIGALSTAPGATSGIYALKYSLHHGADAGSWIELKQDGSLTAEQWDLLGDHIRLGARASVVAILVVVTWIACSDRWRKNLRWPLLAAMILSQILLTAGAWHGGEVVYRTGLAVNAGDPGAKLNTFDYVISPQDAHAVGAGVIAALAALGIGLAIRRLTQPDDSRPSSLVWILIALVAVATALLGLHIGEMLSFSGIAGAFRSQGDQPFQPRSAVHIVLAGAIILLSILLAVVLWRRPRWRVPQLILIVLLAAIVAGQIWLGILLMCDSPSGRLTHFQTDQEVSP